MAGYRSENGKFPNKPNHRDLSMTLYPNQLDTRDVNPNMKGFTNVGEGQIPDFVMAEYVNALSDAIMSMQRSMGKTPMVYFGAQNTTALIESGTMDSRMTRIEDGLFDERYGGKGWVNNESRPTLRYHSHTGLNGQPPKINLTQEVIDRLPKQNLNLDQTNAGLTGADIKMSQTDNATVAAGIYDKLSSSKGGTVSAPLTVTGYFQSRYSKEYSTDNLPVLTNALLESVPSLTGKALKSHDTSATILMNQSLSSLHLGKYVAIVRIKLSKDSSLNQDSNVARFRIGNGQAVNASASDFSNDTFRQFYYVFDHNVLNENIIIEKLQSTNMAAVSIDNILIQPMHPSVLDR